MSFFIYGGNLSLKFFLIFGRIKILRTNVWDCRICRGTRGLSGSVEGFAPARIPRIRQRGGRHGRQGRCAQRLQMQGQGLRPGAFPRGQGAGRKHRHRAYALGDARRAERRERPSALLRIGEHRTDTQRHHRELPGAQGRARGERLHVPQQHRFRGAREPDRVHPHDGRLHAARSRAAGPAAGRRRLCHRRDREGQPRRNHRRAPEQPDGHRHRRRGIFPQLGRRFGHRIHAGFRLCERRGDRRHQPQQAAEDRHAGQPRGPGRYQEAADEHFAARKGRLSAFHAQGDLRAAQDHRGLHPRPHKPRYVRGEAVGRDRQPRGNSSRPAASYSWRAGHRGMRR